jgi:TM2 domain-containing membrane protein YozV
MNPYGAPMGQPPMPYSVAQPQINVVVQQTASPTTNVVSGVQPWQPSPKSRLAYVLLGLFLGALGVHNFYAGYAGRGIAQLLISLLFCWIGSPVVVAIWALIEVIAVDHDAQGVKMS